MNIRNFFTIILLAIIASSCMDEATVSQEFELDYFAIPNQNGRFDLVSKTFTIDTEPFTVAATSKQYDIYNNEVFPYGVVNDSLVIAYSSSNNTSFYTLVDNSEGEKDSVISVVSRLTKFDFSGPVFIYGVSPDGSMAKQYRINISTEATNPDEIIWEQKSSTLFEQGDEMQGYSVDDKLIVISSSEDATTGNVSTSIHSSLDGKTWNSVIADNTSFPVGMKHTVSQFNGKVYLTGYLAKNAGVWEKRPELWSSTDGINFTKDTTNLPFGDVALANASSFKGKLYVFGGSDIIAGKNKLEDALYMDGKASNLSNAIYTFDGTAWAKSNSTLPTDMPSRLGYYAYYNGKLLYFSGETSEGVATTTWASDNGTYWVKLDDNEALSYKSATVEVYDDRLFLIGGELLSETSNYMREMENEGQYWSTINPQTDAATSQPEAFASRAGHVSIVDDSNNIWIIGGYSKAFDSEPVQVNDVWHGKMNKFN